MFDIVSYNYAKTQYQGNAIIFTVSHKRAKLYCPARKSRKVILSLEGTNNKIKTMKRIAYGFRDM